MDVSLALEHLGNRPTQGRVLLGFDAFIDRICRSVSGLGGGRIESMTEMGERLSARREKSGNLMLRQISERMGGNVPNTANVLSSLGAEVACIGAFGRDEIRRPFAPLAERCRLISYAEPGSCIALEFAQCKLFLGENAELDDLTWSDLTERVGMDTLLREFGAADLIGLFNWGELRSTQRFWEGLASDVLPCLPERTRTFFVDFSDMSGRSAEEIRRMLDTLRRFRQYGRMIVSVNRGEWDSLGEALCSDLGEEDAVVMHAPTGALLHTRSGQARLTTRFSEHPALLIGGGDSFNAGFCFGLLSGLSPQDCLKTANAAASLYIRTGRAPQKKELLCEIRQCMELWG